MKKIADFIVNVRTVIIFIFVGLMAFSIWGMSQVKIEYDITSYLPEATDTRKALEIMEKEFTTYGTATIMVRNISFEDANTLHNEIAEIDGVKSFEFENTPDYYRESCALFKITFAGDGDDELSANAYYTIVKMLDKNEIFISAKPVDTYADDLQNEINTVLLMAVGIIIAVLLFTSQSFADVIVFLLTFGVSALLNMGTNYWFGTISFISNSVCVILQLALAIDYAIILSHRFAEEKNNGFEPVEAMKNALAKAIVEIGSSSLTTIAGLLALATMSLRLGADMGFVLAKSIVCSMVTVFLFMPAISLMFSKAIDKTTHKSFVPKISFVGKFDVKMRYLLIAVFVVLVSVGGYFSFQTQYVYSEASIDTNRPSETQVAIAETEKVFGYHNQFVVLMPGRNFDRQREVLEKIKSYDMIKNATGLSNQKIKMNGVAYYLTDKINYKEFASLLAADETLTDSVYSAYAFLSQNSAEDGIREVTLYQTNKSIYKVSLLDLCDCAFDNDDFIEAYLSENKDALDYYDDLKQTIQDAEAQLLGPNYSRLVFELDGETESPETFAFIAVLLDEIKPEYPETIFAGDSMSAYDLNESFTGDNIKVSLFTVLFVFIILIFTFGSWGLPIPLTATIQTAIFVNFSYYAFAGINVFFFVYLIVSAIQMGATIDYAIVVTTRYEELKKEVDKRQAIIDALDQAFPTIITSGTIMAMAGLLIGINVSNTLIATLGMCLMRGVLVSTLLVMTVMPALLYVFDKPLDKTMFKPKKKKERQNPLNMIKQIIRSAVAETSVSATEDKQDENN